MNLKSSRRKTPPIQTPRLLTFGLSAACLLLAAPGARVHAAPAPVRAVKTPAPVKMAAPVEALLYSSMPSTDAHRPAMAMDGDPATFFRTAYGMGDGDEFLVLLSRPVPVRSLRVVTGDPDGQDILTDATVQTSADGVHFSRAADFNASGVADAALGGRPVLALRLKLNPGKGASALAVREISLNALAPIAHVQEGPGRGFYDISDNPDLAGWARKAEAQMESFWPDTEAILYTDKFIPPNMVTVEYKTGPDVTGVAATGGGVMTVNTAWCRAHPDDTGLTVHETAHVIQSIPAYNPVWLIEGTADYIRWVRFEPTFPYRIDPQKSTYHDSYRTTAAFLAYCELHYDSGLVTKLNRAVRFGTYNVGMFKQYCGKDVDSLWAEFVAAYQADPKGVLLPPVPAADRPRAVPAVSPGGSRPLDLSSAFGAVGVYAEGAAPPANAAGVDGEGSGYSAKLLAGATDAKNVRFTLGPANAPDVALCRGQVVAVPAGRASSLWLLGTATEGSQRAQTFLVTYTDGTQESLVQNFSDWYQPAGFAGETRAVRMPYRLTGAGARDPRPFYVYRYGFPVNPAKTVKSVTLPDNPNVKILAMTLAN